MRNDHDGLTQILKVSLILSRPRGVGSLSRIFFRNIPPQKIPKTKKTPFSERQVITTDPTNILIRSLLMKKERDARAKKAKEKAREGVSYALIKGVYVTIFTGDVNL